MVEARRSTLSSIAEPPVTILNRLEWFCNTIYHQILTLVTGFIIYVFCKYYEPSSKNFQHYVLCTLAYMPLMAEGLILFSESNVWSLKVSRTNKYWIHGPLLLISTIANSVGIIIKYRDSKHGHLFSDHAKLGVASWVFSLVACLFGLFAFYSTTLRKIVRPVVVKVIHNILGLVTFITGMASLILGLTSHILGKDTHEELRHTTVSLTVIITIWTGLVVLISIINQLKDVFISY